MTTKNLKSSADCIPTTEKFMLAPPPKLMLTPLSKIIQPPSQKIYSGACTKNGLTEKAMHIYIFQRVYKRTKSVLSFTRMSRSTVVWTKCLT